MKAGKRLDDDALEGLTEESKAFLRGCLPSLEDVMLGFALPVWAAPEAERATLVAMQIEVLEGIEADPEDWCVCALRLAAQELGGHRG